MSDDKILLPNTGKHTDAPFSKNELIYDETTGWKYRIILASLPTTCGAVVRAVLAKNPRNGYAYGLTCTILKDGLVVTDVRDPAGHVTRDCPIGTIVAVRDSFRRLADHCKLSDTDREAMFEELRKWIKRDWRAKLQA